MKKQTRRKAAPWQVFLQGLAAAAGVYLCGILLLALLLMRGVLPESCTLTGLGVLCLLSGFAGGLLCLGRTSLGPLPAALSGAGLFAAALAAVGLCWNGVDWAGEGGGLLACILGGGLLAGLLGGRKPRRKRNRPLSGHM